MSNTGRMIDTHAAVKELTDAGMPEDQAEAVVSIQRDLLENQAASKHDVEKSETALRNDLERVETSLRGDMVQLETSLRGEIQDVRNDLTLLRKDMETLGSYLLTRLGALVVVGGGFVIMVLEFLR